MSFSDNGQTKYGCDKSSHATSNAPLKYFKFAINRKKNTDTHIHRWQFGFVDKLIKLSNSFWWVSIWCLQTQSRLWTSLQHVQTKQKLENCPFCVVSLFESSPKHNTSVDYKPHMSECVFKLHQQYNGIFSILYLLWSFPHNRDLGLKTPDCKKANFDTYSMRKKKFGRGKKIFSVEFCKFCISINKFFQAMKIISAERKWSILSQTWRLWAEIGGKWSSKGDVWLLFWKSKIVVFGDNKLNSVHP